MGTTPESMSVEPGEVKPSISGDSQLLLVQSQPTSVQLQPPLRLPGQPQQVNLLHTTGGGSHGQQLGSGSSSEATSGPHLLAQPSVSLGEQPGPMAQNLLGSQQPLGLERPIQNNTGSQPPKSGPAPQSGQGPPGVGVMPTVGQLRAQLQGVLAKTPQLRHLSPQQQQQLQALLMQRQLQQSQAVRQTPPGQESGTQPSPLQGLLGCQPQPGVFFCFSDRTPPGARGRVSTSGPTPAPCPTRSLIYRTSAWPCSSHTSTFQSPRAKETFTVTFPQCPANPNPSRDSQAPGASLGAASWEGLTCCCPACRCVLWQGTRALGPLRQPPRGPEARAEQPGSRASGAGERTGGT